MPNISLPYKTECTSLCTHTVPQPSACLSPPFLSLRGVFSPFLLPASPSNDRLLCLFFLSQTNIYNDVVEILCEVQLASIESSHAAPRSAEQLSLLCHPTKSQLCTIATYEVIPDADMWANVYIVTTYFFFPPFLMTQQTHVTMYYYFLTCSCDSLVQIHPEVFVSIFSCLLILNQLTY